MYITGIQIREVGPFAHDLSLTFHPQVNLFIGPNAVGKSTIIRGMSAVFRLDPPLPGTEGVEPSVSKDWPWFEGDEHYAPSPIWEKVASLYVPAGRISLIDVFPGDVPTKIIGRADDVMFLSQIESEITNIHKKLTQAHCWDDIAVLNDAIQSGYSCARNICPEILRGSEAHPFVDTVGDWPAKERIVQPGMGLLDTSNPYDQPRYAGELSSGSQTTLLWLYALAVELAQQYNWRSDWKQHPAILLIDEIENHLHPTWQRRVIPALLKHFPCLQIFASTHSPFVVAGLKAGQVHLLNRDENGVITATTNEQDIIGWTADEILRTFMGVDDPTDDETAAAARELRQLRDEGPRQEPLDEEQRRERMRELRQLVDRDLLAGGPAAAQEELFEQQFAEALEKYRQSRNLNQENS